MVGEELEFGILLPKKIGITVDIENILAQY